jgi:hypothetical protein
VVLAGAVVTSVLGYFKISRWTSTRTATGVHLRPPPAKIDERERRDVGRTSVGKKMHENTGDVKKIGI